MHTYLQSLHDTQDAADDANGDKVDGQPTSASSNHDVMQVQ